TGLADRYRLQREAPEGGSLRQRHVHAKAAYFRPQDIRFHIFLFANAAEIIHIAARQFDVAPFGVAAVKPVAGFDAKAQLQRLLTLVGDRVFRREFAHARCDRNPLFDAHRLLLAAYPDMAVAVEGQHRLVRAAAADVSLIGFGDEIALLTIR